MLIPLAVYLPCEINKNRSQTRDKAKVPVKTQPT